MARRHKQFNLVPEVFWLDAGWYTDSGAQVYDWCDCVGTWTPDTTRFLNGLRPLSDEAHRLGARFLLWFEPEARQPRIMARAGTPAVVAAYPRRNSRHCWTWAIPRHWNGSARTSAT
ncbi:MAG: alpha-galactosidase [Alistipes indistinctus]